jgi:hypothetical protein
MNLRDSVLNYLTDKEKEMQQLIAWFLNDVMNEEVAQQTASASWSRRVGRSNVAMSDGSIVLLGGSNMGTPKNDMWRSTDKGATWKLVNASAE